MAVSKTYISTAGLNYIQDISLVMVSPKLVARAGTVYSLVNGTPGNLQCKHDRNEGKLIFDSAFNYDQFPGPNSPNDIMTTEKVFVLLK